MTDWHMHRESDSYAWIARQGCLLAQSITKHLAIQNLSVMRCGEYITRKRLPQEYTHTGPYQFAFGYYVRMPEYAPIIFPTANYEYNPKSGDLVVFPGSGFNMKSNLYRVERIMLAGNLRNDKWS